MKEILGPICQKCDCFKCSKFPNCFVDFPTSWRYCEAKCGGVIGVVGCEFADKGNVK